MTKPRRLAAGLLSFGLMIMTHAAWAIPFDQIQDKYPVNPPDVSHVPDAKPVALPYSKFGNPVNYDVNGVHYHVLSTSKGYHQNGFASWYGTKFQGRRTSSGEPYNMYAMTAASTTLPIPSFVRVTNLQNGKSVIVKVNDRGPFHSDRIMDLSYAAAARLDILQHGTAPVHVEAIDANGNSSGSSSAVTSIYDLRPDSSDLHQDNSADALRESVLVRGDANTNNGRTFVQVASFTKSTNAHQLANNLRDYVNKPVSINQVASADGSRYRVLIGPLDSQHDALNVQSSLRRDGLSQGVVVQA
jgi:rare lipoprotein A